MWISAIILNFHHTFLQRATHPFLIEAMCALVPVRAYVCCWHPTGRLLREDMPGQRARWVRYGGKLSGGSGGEEEGRELKEWTAYRTG